MRRRLFICIAGAIFAIPDISSAQARKLPLVGFLSLFTEEALRVPVAGFLAGLAASGYSVNRDVEIEYRWANGAVERLPELADDLVRRDPAVIVAAGGNYSAEAAKAATRVIPIVFTAVSDPVRAGLVASFNKPGANVTGISIFSHELDAKRLDLLRELIPSARTVGGMLNPKNPTAALQRSNLEAAAASAGLKLLLELAGSEAEISGAIARLSDQGAKALIVGADPFFTEQRVHIVTAAQKYRLPGIYQWRQFAEAGGLASYGPDFSEAYRQSGIYVGRILRGAKPADLPVLQPTQFQLVINMKTAKALGLTLPPSILARADEVIE